MKNKNIWLFIIVLIIGILFRFLYLDKTGGLSYDELVSYMQASRQNILSTIFYTFKTDVHMPLYQIFLHLWCKIFSFSDLSLRAFSALCGVISIIFACLAGLELPPPRKTSLFCAGLFAINSFFIYYSQEVRMYSFLTLLATISVLLILKIKNRPENKWNYIWLILISFCLIHTYTIAFIYVVALFASVLFLLIKQKEKNNVLIYSAITLIITCLPVIIFLTLNQSKYTTQINGYYCDWSSLFIVLQNLYTPVLESLANNPPHYMHIFLSTFSVSKLIFIILPILCGLAGIYTAVKKDKVSLVILAPAVIFFIAEVIAVMTTNFKILPRYVIISMPALLIITAYGFSILTEYKKLKYYLIPGIFIIVNISYLLFAPNSAYKMPRVGFRPLAEFINQSDLQNSDFILVWNRKEILDKYLNKKANIISILKDFAYKSEVMLSNEQKFNSMPLDGRKEILYPYFYQNQIPYNTLLLMNYIITNMQPSQKFIITTTSYFDDFDKVKFKQLVETNYKSTSLNDLLTIKSLIDIKEICDINLKFVSKKEIAPYVIRIYSK